MEPLSVSKVRSVYSPLPGNPFQFHICPLHFIFLRNNIIFDQIEKLKHSSRKARARYYILEKEARIHTSFPRLEDISN